MFHAVLILGSHDPLVNSLNWRVEMLRMPLLMTISGILAFDKLGRPYYHSLKSSANLLWIYILWTPIIFAIEFSVGSNRQSLLYEFVAPTTHLWFIGGLATLYAMIPAVRCSRAGLILIVSFVALLSVKAGNAPSTFGYAQLLRFSFFFFSGLYASPFLRNMLRSPKIIMMVPWLAAFVLFTIANNSTAAWLPWTPFQSLVSAAMCGITLLICVRLAKVPAVGTALSALGRATLPIYLMHLPMLTVLGRSTGIGDLSLTPLLALSGVIILLCLLLESLLLKANAGWLFSMPEGLGRLVRGSMS